MKKSVYKRNVYKMSIEISLTNFRCWEDKTISFPSKGLCLLHGRSGKGKSSILNAIVYAITGKGKNISTFQKKSTTVRILIDGLTITRKRGPNRLIVERDATHYEDDVGQAVIDSLFGKEFCNTSYIDQDNVNSFVTLSPSEKFEFLERLLLSTDGIDDMRERVRRNLSDAKDGFTTEDSRANTLRQLLSKMPNADPPPLRLKEWNVDRNNVCALIEKTTSNLEVSERNRRTLSSKIKKAEADIQTASLTQEKRNKLLWKMDELCRALIAVSGNEEDLERERSECEQLQQQHHHHNEYVRYAALLAKYEAIKAEHDKERVMLEKERDGLARRSMTEQSVERLKKAQELMHRLVRLEEKLTDPIDQEQIDRLEKEWRGSSERSAMLQSLITQCETRYECPSCEKVLEFSNKRLVISQGNRQDLTCLQEEYQSAKTSATSLRADLDQAIRQKIMYDQSDVEYNRLFDKLEETLALPDEVVPQDEIETRLASLQVILNRHVEIDHAIRRIDMDRFLQEKRKEMDACTVKEDVTVPSLSLDELRDRLTVIRETLSTRRSLEREREMVKAELAVIVFVDRKDVEASLPSERERRDAYEKKVDRYREMLEPLKNWEKVDRERQAYEKIEYDMRQSEEKKTKWADRIRGLVKLRDHIKHAEQRCITDFINSLNQHAASYISDFFPDEDIVVELTTEAKVKEKVSLHFQVSYRQMTGDLSFLSGGERDRVNLAFTLAFSELVDNRVLLLDECISSLDAETTNIVLEQMKEKYKGKLVIVVSHQANLGFFDDVIEI